MVTTDGDPDAVRVMVTLASEPPVQYHWRSTRCAQLGALAVNVRTVTGGTTVTLTEAVAVPPGPVAVRVYVVVVFGTSVRVPSTATAPTPWSIEQLVAFVVCQLRVVLQPAWMGLGLAVKELMTGVGTGVVGSEMALK